MKKMFCMAQYLRNYQSFYKVKNINANYLYDNDIINPEIDFQALGIVLGYL